jgi:hypothetical protein
MVKRITGLDRGPKMPPVFGGEMSYPRAPIAAGDEVRCLKARQEIYIGVLGVSADGWLVGEVVTFGILNGRDAFEVRLGEVVEIHIDRIQAVLRGTTLENHEACEVPEPLLRAARG